MEKQAASDTRLGACRIYTLRSGYTACKFYKKFDNLLLKESELKARKGMCIDVYIMMVTCLLLFINKTLGLLGYDIGIYVALATIVLSNYGLCNLYLNVKNRESLKHVAIAIFLTTFTGVPWFHVACYVYSFGPTLKPDMYLGSLVRNRKLKDSLDHGIMKQMKVISLERADDLHFEDPHEAYEYYTDVRPDAGDERSVDRHIYLNTVLAAEAVSKQISYSNCALITQIQSKLQSARMAATLGSANDRTSSSGEENDSEVKQCGENVEHTDDTDSEMDQGQSSLAKDSTNTEDTEDGRDEYPIEEIESEEIREINTCVMEEADPNDAGDSSLCDHEIEEAESNDSDEVIKEECDPERRRSEKGEATDIKANGLSTNNDAATADLKAAEEDDDWITIKASKKKSKEKQHQADTYSTAVKKNIKHVAKTTAVDDIRTAKTKSANQIGKEERKKKQEKIRRATKREVKYRLVYDGKPFER